MTKEQELYELGFSLAQVASLVYRSKTAVHTILVNEGVEMRPIGGNNRHVSHTDLRRAEYLYTTLLWSTPEIAIYEGLARDTVNNRLKSAGVRMRTAAESYKLKKTRITGPERLPVECVAKAVMS